MLNAQQLQRLVKSYGKPAVVMAEVLQELLQDIQEEEMGRESDVPKVREVTELVGDGHGLNFCAKLEDGWKRIIITTP